jgi:hypothetical protein
VGRLFTHHLNDQDIIHFFEDAVPIHGDAIITGSHLWKNVSVDELIVKDKGSINGQDLEPLFTTAIYTRGKENQKFSGKKKSFVANIIKLLLFN